MGEEKALILNSILYTFAAALEYWLFGWLAIFGIKLPIFSALLQNASWPIQIIFYRMERHKSSPREITQNMYTSYLILGLLSTFITITRTIGLTSLPPAIYVICANTEIVFETIMTKIILQRSISSLQTLSVGLVLLGVVVSLYDPHTHRFGHKATVDRGDLLLGVCTSLASRFASSLNTILAERFLGSDAKSRFGVLECSLANSLLPSLVLPLTLLVVPEYKKWRLVLIQPNLKSSLLVALLCLCVTVCKHMDRLSKFSIVSGSSTLFYAVIDSNMKVLAAIGSVFFFRRSVSIMEIIGFGFIFFSLIISYFDKRNKNLGPLMQSTNIPSIDYHSLDTNEEDAIMLNTFPLSHNNIQYDYVTKSNQDESGMTYNSNNSQNKN